jgi:hypothetical protein
MFIPAHQTGVTLVSDQVNGTILRQISMFRPAHQTGVTLVSGQVNGTPAHQTGVSLVSGGGDSCQRIGKFLVTSAPVNSHNTGEYSYPKTLNSIFRFMHEIGNVRLVTLISSLVLHLRITNPPPCETQYV